MQRKQGRRRISLRPFLFFGLKYLNYEERYSILSALSFICVIGNVAERSASTRRGDKGLGGV